MRSSLLCLFILFIYFSPTHTYTHTHSRTDPSSSAGCGLFASTMEEPNSVTGYLNLLLPVVVQVNQNSPYSTSSQPAPDHAALSMPLYQQ